MRELEFLPDWYGVVRRRRAWVIAQAWGTGALLLVLVIWTCVSNFRAMTAQGEQAQVIEKVTRSQKLVDELHLLQLDKQTWNERGEVLDKIGLSVESSRLLTAIADATPATITLTNFNISTDEKQDLPKSAAAARAMKDKAPTMDRTLKVRINGIAPSDADVCDMVTKLSEKTFFEDVAMTNSKETDFEGRLVREFELAFTIDLNATAGK